MPRAVIDTNILVSGLLSTRGSPYQVVTRWRSRQFECVVTHELIGEFHDVLGRPRMRAALRLQPGEIEAILISIIVASTLVAPERSLPVQVRDRDDDLILAAALGGDVDFIVTGDGDLLVLRDDPRLGSVRIVTATEFLQILDSQS